MIWCPLLPSGLTGTQFDPELVAVFCQMMDDGERDTDG